MQNRAVNTLLAIIILATVAMQAGCNGNLAASVSLPLMPQLNTQVTTQNAPGFPRALPVDQAQPWERLDAAGQVFAQRNASSIDANSEFVPGVERYLDNGNVADYGEAATLSSGSASAKQLSYAMYRISLGADQPGAVAADVNLHPRTGGSGLSEYYLGLSDYSHARWEWHGPFSDYHVRLSTGAAVHAGGGYTSPLGDLFVCIAAYDGAGFDIVGLGANRYDGVDVTAPAAPGGLTATPVGGGLRLAWNAVLASDLAGYRIYWRKAVFADPHSPGVVVVNYLEGATLHFLALPAAGAHSVAVAAVDFSGNESALSTVVSAAPLAGTPPPLMVTVDAASVQRGDPVTVTATGAVSYSFDLNGDGTIDLSNATGIASVDTTGVGIIRPFVIGEGVDSTMTALGGVSLIVLGNTRPVATATASPQSGPAPLGVTLTAIASDIEDPPASLTYDWDFNGDGTYDANTNTLTPPKHGYNTPGTFNVKFRVMDSQGAWAVDSAVINVAPRTGLDHTAVISSNVHQNMSAVMVDGLPAIIYQDSFSESGYFIRAKRIEGLTWGTPVLVFTDVDPASHISVAVVNGNPAIAYSNGPEDLQYVRATTPQGSAWAAPVSVGGANALFCELITADGNPAIGYYDEVADQPLFVRAGNPDGTFWAAPVAVTPAGAGDAASTAIVSGYPAMTFSDSALTKTYYCRATNVAGSAWGAPVELFAFMSADATDLQVIGGIPCAAFGNDSSAVYFSRALDVNGDNWSDPIVAISRPSLTFHVADVTLAEFDGHAAVAFTDYNDGTTWYGEALDPTGIQWGLPLVLAPYDPADLTQGKPLLLNLNGTAGIVHWYYYLGSGTSQVWLSRKYR